MTTIAVVRVVSTHPPSQGAFVEINAADFDPLKHTLYSEDQSPAIEHDEPAARGASARARKSTGAPANVHR